MTRLSRYAELQAEGRCGHCGRPPKGDLKICYVCLAKKEQIRLTGKSAGWERVAWMQMLNRLAGGRLMRKEPPKQETTPIRTDDPRFGTPEWILSLKFDLTKIDKTRPPFWLLKQVYWQVRREMFPCSWRSPLTIDETYLCEQRAVANHDAARIHAAYERRLFEMGIGYAEVGLATATSGPKAAITTTRKAA